MFLRLKDLLQKQRQRANWVIVVEFPKALWDQLQTMVAGILAEEEVES